MATTGATEVKDAESAPTVQPKGLDPIVKGFQEAFIVDLDAHKMQWELSSRLYALYRGKLPDELQGTFSKIMLNVAHSIVQERVTRLHENLFSREKDSPTLEAESPIYELLAPQAEAWLRNMMNHPSKLNMPAEFLARTLPSACVMGTAFRLPYVTHRQNESGKWLPILNSKHVDFFQILPAPNGGLINPIDRNAEDCLDHFHWIDWWTDKQIKALEKYEGFRKSDVEELLKTKPESTGEYDRAFSNQMQIVGGVSLGGTKEDWRIRMRDIEGVSGRRRVVTWFQRDRMSIIAQDRFVIYSGPNPLPGGMLPLISYYTCPDGNNVYGISGLEMVEDIIRAMMMNFNFRQDYLAQVMFPTKWIRSDVMGGKPAIDFADKPYAVHEYPTGVDIRQALHIDRMPEITPQTFQDEASYKTFLQDIYGLTDYSKGMPGRITDNRTAAGLITMVQQAQGRLSAESFMLEKFGISQEGRLLLAMGSKWFIDNDVIRVAREDGGFNWMTIEAEAIADGYTIHTHGTRFMQERDQSFQRLMSLYPLWNNDPYIDQVELRKETGQAAGVFTDVDRIVHEVSPAAGMPDEQNPMGGMSGSMTPNNRSGQRPTNRAF